MDWLAHSKASAAALRATLFTRSGPGLQASPS
jgi:hypothetical protein